MTDDAGPADAVAVRDGRIVFVGSSTDVRPLIGPATRVIELDGETLLPGFQDAHIHPIQGGMLSRSCDLHGLADAAAYLEAIAAYAPPTRTASGSTAAAGRCPPSRAASRTAASSTPSSRIGRPSSRATTATSAWANSRALAISGIDRTTPDPANGRIVRDADGEPAGTLHDGAIELVYRHAPKATRADLLDGLRAAQATCTRSGSPPGRTRS